MHLYKIQRTPGFRFNGVDLMFIALLCGLSLWLYRAIPNSSAFGLPLYLGLSFFLFCNVFRIGNRLEPFWYIPFFVVTLYCLNEFDLALFWAAVIYFLEPLKWILIAYQFWKGPYRGIGSRLADDTHKIQSN